MGVSTIVAQTIVDFEELTLEPTSHWDGSDLSGSFTSSYLTFYNNYDETYSSWMGFAYTNETDNTTFEWTNSFTSASGSGFDGSANYAVSYVGSDFMNDYSPIPTSIKIDLETAPEIIPGMYVSLNANASLYMANEDTYSNGNHWLLVEVTAHNTETDFAESREIYLADYRFENSEFDYKLSEWTYVDLTWAEGVDSITFVMLSSDSGDWGINTPSYFCIDDFGTEAPVGTPMLTSNDEDIEEMIVFGESIDLLALAVGGVQPYTYQWSSEYGLDAYDVQNPTATPDVTTTWTVTITDAIGAEVTQAMIVNVNPVNVEMSEMEKTAVYINSNENIFVESTGEISSLVVFDMTGKLLIEKDVANSSLEVDFSNYPSGMYIVNVIVDGRQVTRRIVK